MIRDPSDGSVRDAPKAETVSVKPRPSPDTGIRQPTRTDAQERLERSRKWLKDYQERKRREYANAGGYHGEEHSTDGRSGNDQGKAES